MTHDGQNRLIVDEITTLRLLYNMRANMQGYVQNHSQKSYKKSLIMLYSILADDKNLAQNVRDFISSYTIKISFNPYAFKTTTQKDDKALKKASKTTAKQVTAAKLLKKQIVEEIKYQHMRGKMTDVTEDEKFESVMVDSNYFIVRIKGKDEPIKFKLYRRGKDVFSSLGFQAMTNDQYKGKGFNRKTFEVLQSLGENGFALDLDKQTSDENIAKRYLPSQYKSYLGLSSNEELSSEQKKELQILNSLAAFDQSKFIIGVKERKIKQKQHQEFFDALYSAENIFKILANSDELGALFVKYGMENFADRVQDDFIEIYIKKDKKNIWNNFVKDNEGQNRFSYYDILVNNLIFAHKDIFDGIYNFQNTKEMQKKLTDAYVRVKQLATPALPDGLCGEILARGIFHHAVNNNTDSQKLKNMNLLLSELGLNIKFVEKNVTKVPPMAIENAYQQAKIDREAFEMDKKTPVCKTQESLFKKHLDKLGISEYDEKSIHHFLALKYNAFIDEELNQNTNYVRTLRQNPWNFDVCKFYYGLFFLIKDWQFYILV